MNWWKLEQGDLFMNNHPVCSQSTQTNLLLMSKMWTLTPTKNQTCLNYPDYFCTGWMIECVKFKTNRQNMQHNSDKHFVIRGMFISSILQASVFMEKNYSDNLHSIKIQGGISQRNRCSTYLRNCYSAKSNEICGVNWIHLEDSSWKHLSLVGGGKVISLSHTKVSNFVLCFGKMHQNQVDVVQEFITIQNFGHKWWWASGIRWNIFPGFSSATKSKSSCRKWVYNQKISLDRLSPCRCFKTCHGVFF